MVYVHCLLLQVLVLLDVTPDQSMVDEGMAREVINRIQKLRKKVSLSDKEQLLFWSFALVFSFGFYCHCQEGKERWVI